MILGGNYLRVLKTILPEQSVTLNNIFSHGESELEFFALTAIEKVPGQAKFTGDLGIPDLLDAKVLRSPLPHAVIESIDIGKAEALPGVGAVLTRADLKEIDPFYGNCLRDSAAGGLGPGSLRRRTGGGRRR